MQAFTDDTKHTALVCIWEHDRNIRKEEQEAMDEI